MDHLQGVDDSYNDDFIDGAPKKNFKLRIGLVLAMFGLLSTTFAANISIGNGKKEFGQGIFQIKACDQWVGLGLTAGEGAENIYVKNVKLYGFDPRLCLGRTFQVKLFASGSNTPMNLYIDTGTAGGAVETATMVSLFDTTTAYTSNYNGPGGTGYDGWAADAVTLINKQGFNIGWYSDYLSIDYTASTGIYTIFFVQPRARVGDVINVTIESAKLS